MFEYLKRYDIQGERTVEFRLDMLDLPACPVLMLAPGTADNRPLLRAVLRRNRTQGGRTGTSDSAVRDSMNSERELFVAHVLKGWRGVTDENGAEVPFSRENAREFVAALPDWIFLRAQTFATDPTNFLDGGDLGNSSGG